MSLLSSIAWYHPKPEVLESMQGAPLFTISVAMGAPREASASAAISFVTVFDFQKLIYSEILKLIDRSATSKIYKGNTRKGVSCIGSLMRGVQYSHKENVNAP